MDVAAPRAPWLALGFQQEAAGCRQKQTTYRALLVFRGAFIPRARTLLFFRASVTDAHAAATRELPLRVRFWLLFPRLRSPLAPLAPHALRRFAAVPAAVHAYRPSFPRGQPAPLYTISVSEINPAHHREGESLAALVSRLAVSPLRRFWRDA